MQRVCVFKWVGAVAVFLGADGLGCHLAPLLRPVYREYVDSREMAGGHSLRVVYQCMQLSQTLEHGISFGLSMNYHSVLSKCILHTLCQ